MLSYNINGIFFSNNIIMYKNIKSCVIHSGNSLLFSSDRAEYTVVTVLKSKWGRPNRIIF